MHLGDQNCNIIDFFFFSDFFKGKTVFNHWLPGICYSNITFQLVSEATFNKSTLVEYSGVSHEPKQHRTGKSSEESNLVKKQLSYMFVAYKYSIILRKILFQS